MLSVCEEEYQDCQKKDICDVTDVKNGCMNREQLTNQASSHVTTVKLKNFCKFTSLYWRATLPDLLHTLTHFAACRV